MYSLHFRRMICRSAWTKHANKSSRVSWVSNIENPLALASQSKTIVFSFLVSSWIAPASHRALIRPGVPRNTLTTGLCTWRASCSDYSLMAMCLANSLWRRTSIWSAEIFLVFLVTFFVNARAYLSLRALYRAVTCNVFCVRKSIWGFCIESTVLPRERSFSIMSSRTC